jgi:hypothetical protein
MKDWIDDKVEGTWVEVIAYCIIFDLLLLIGWGI